jgi:hypothetical protein
VTARAYSTRNELKAQHYRAAKKFAFSPKREYTDVGVWAEIEREEQLREVA